VYAVCRTVWYGFVGVSVCCVCGSLVCVWGSECVLCVGQFGVCLWGVSVCCLWDSLVWVCGSECVLCVGQFVVCLWE